MADATATYAIDLSVDSSAVDTAANALASLKAKIQADTAALSEMQRAFKALQGGANVNPASIDALKTRMVALKASIAGSTDKFVQMGGSFDKAGAAPALMGIGDAASKAKEPIGALASVLGGPLGKSSQSVLMVGDAFKKLSALGPAALIGGVAIAVVALTAALLYGAFAAVKFAIGAANTARDMRLADESLLQGAMSVSAYQKALRSLEDSTGASGDSLRGWTKQLLAAKLPASQMGDALRAISLAQAGMGDEGAAKLVQQLTSGQKTAKELAATMEKQFGGLVAKKVLSLDAQFAKFKRNIDDLFGALHIDAFLVQLADVLSMFDSTTASGRALRAVVSLLFQPLIDATKIAGPLVKAMFLGALVAALKLYVALKPVVSAVLEFLNIKPNSGLSAAFMIGKVAVYAFVAVLGLLGAALALAYAPIAILITAVKFLASHWREAATVMAAVMAAPLAPILALGAAVGVLSGKFQSVAGSIASGLSPSSVLSGIQSVYGALSSGIDRIVAIDWVSVGKSLPMGIVNGINAGVGWVIDACSNLGASAIAAIKSKLQINSPSKVFAKVGDSGIAGGLAKGVDAGSSDVDASVSSLVQAPSVASAQASAKAPATQPAGRGAGNTYNITITGVSNAEQLKEQSFLDKLAAAIEGAAVSSGAPLGAT